MENKAYSSHWPIVVSKSTPHGLRVYTILPAMSTNTPYVLYWPLATSVRAFGISSVHHHQATSLPQLSRAPKCFLCWVKSPMTSLMLVMLADFARGKSELIAEHAHMSFYPWFCRFERQWFCRRLSLKENPNHSILRFSSRQQHGWGSMVLQKKITKCRNRDAD